VLQRTEQRPTDDAAAPVEFLIAFVRALIRNYPSGDSIALALHSARAHYPITPEQEAQFRKAIALEIERTPWPKDFF